MSIPFTAEEIVGEWGLNTVVPGEIRTCANDGDRKCGQIFEFIESGIGYIRDRVFNWSVNDDGTLMISMVDGTGSMDVMKVRDMTDGAIEVLTTTSTGGDAFIQHSLGVRRDLRSLDNAIADNAFVGIPMTNGFSITDPDSRRDDSGALYDTFGFELSANGYLINFNTYNVGVYDYIGATLKQGTWTLDGTIISKEFCIESWGVYDEPFLEYPRCSNDGLVPIYGSDTGPWSTVYRRTWDLLSAVDLDDDGTMDRFYAIETLLALEHPQLERCNSEEAHRCVDDRPVILEVDRLNFYEVMPGFNYRDIDQDGFINSDDQFPFDPAESRDTDGDGIGNNADPDDDDDGVLDADDAFPTDAGESVDTDGDGIGNNADEDDDGDGVNDADDAFLWTHRRP